LQGFGFPLPTTPEVTLQKGKGCRNCRGTGYYGRSGVFEIFPMTDQLKQLTGQRCSAAELQSMAKVEGMTTLKEDAWRKVMSGLTTFEEAVRVTGSN
jgi:general secretion pathway protein E